MKQTIGGDRLGAGGKMEVNMHNYNRSTHDLSSTWRSTMASGTLVPFGSELALPGDIWNVDLACEVLTLPTIGPLFGSYKVQLDVFQVPIRLYNGGLHMNRLGIGMDMSQVKLPQVNVVTVQKPNDYKDNNQINSSCIFKYLGISGIGGGELEAESIISREFNAVPYLAYWSIYKDYYSNKQENRGMVVHTGSGTAGTVVNAIALGHPAGNEVNIYGTTGASVLLSANAVVTLTTTLPGATPDIGEITLHREGVELKAKDIFNFLQWDGAETITLTGMKTADTVAVTWKVESQTIPSIENQGELKIQQFPLKNIDNMRDAILQHPFESGRYLVDTNSEAPYGLPMNHIVVDNASRRSAFMTQEGLGIKTYQSDLFNNWISTEWIDGTNGINEVTAVSTVGDKFTIDALNIANKVYNMLNRIAISGGTYDDWLEAVYTGDRAKSVESPVYQGSLIKELAFQEVVSTAGNVNVTNEGLENGNPTGTLSGRGKLTGKNKGGKMTIKVDEPSYIMMIASITPRLDFSQGNKFDMDLKTLDDLHKPALDAIGYQDLVTQQMVYSDTEWNNTTKIATHKSAGKQPAWINYMTDVNRTYGHFAEPFVEGGRGSMFMTLNRKYEIDAKNGQITDLTTYVDPSKFNNIFAETALDAQNFWVQISKKMIVRRKMSAKVIPNL